MFPNSVGPDETFLAVPWHDSKLLDIQILSHSGKDGHHVAIDLDLLLRAERHQSTWQHARATFFGVVDLRMVSTSSQRRIVGTRCSKCSVSDAEGGPKLRGMRI